MEWITVLSVFYTSIMQIKARLALRDVLELASYVRTRQWGSKEMNKSLPISGIVTQIQFQNQTLLTGNSQSLRSQGAKNKRFRASVFKMAFILTITYSLPIFCCYRRDPILDDARITIPALAYLPTAEVFESWPEWTIDIMVLAGKIILTLIV